MSDLNLQKTFYFGASSKLSTLSSLIMILRDIDIDLKLQKWLFRSESEVLRKVWIVVKNCLWGGKTPLFYHLKVKKTVSLNQFQEEKQTLPYSSLKLKNVTLYHSKAEKCYFIPF